MVASVCLSTKSAVEKYTKASNARTDTAKSAKYPAARRRALVRSSRGTGSIGTQGVTRAAHRVEQGTREPFVDLLAQPADMDIDDVGLGVDMAVPDLLQHHR